MLKTICRSLLLFIVVSALFMTAGCSSLSRKSPESRRQSIQLMRQETLADLYRLRPEVEERIKTAPGYAVFSNANVNVIFASFSGGYGVVRDSATGQDIYMRMGEAGLGLGLGIKDFRAVFIFNTTTAMNRFIDVGWEFGAHADAAVKASDKGISVSGEVVVSDVTIYSLTESGLALQATLKGTRYWPDDDLNFR